MKYSTLCLIALTLCATIALPASAFAQQEKQLSIWERIFGTSERPSNESTNQKAKQEDADEEEAKKEEAKEKSKKVNKEKKDRHFLDEWEPELDDEDNIVP